MTDDDLTLTALCDAIEADQHGLIPVIFDDDEGYTFWKFHPDLLKALALDGLADSGGFLVMADGDGECSLLSYEGVAELEQAWSAISACHWSRPSTA